MAQVNDYEKFLEMKSQMGGNHGFEPVFMTDYLFDFQKSLVTWAINKGRAAIFADCGMGKTPMQLTWAENVVRHTNGNVLILAPLAVSGQTVHEAEKFGIECKRSRDGKPHGKITITNYDQLHNFNCDDFTGIVCDESSIIKHNTGATQKAVTRFMSKMPYRLLCTATAAPNDYVELGTSSEALGELSHSEMLNRFFKYVDDKGQKKETRQQDEAEKTHSYYGKLSFRVAQSIGQWRLKHHAIIPFWRWVSSWARACRMPSDIGFNNDAFILPELIEKTHIVEPDTPPEGMLFCLPAFGLGEEREERKRTLQTRCEYVAKLADHNNPVVIWCHTNDEGDMLEKIIPESKQVAGKTPDNEKENIYHDFSNSNLRVLIIKPKIGAWGLNWQHCNHVITFASHSYEQYYQSIRRCWRFGQKKPVTVDIIATSGEKRVIENMKRKVKQADAMFQIMVNEMNQSENVTLSNNHINAIRRPSWV